MMEKNNVFLDMPAVEKLENLAATNEAEAKSLKERLGAIADAWDTWWNCGTGLCDLVSLSSFNI